MDLGMKPLFVDRAVEQRLLDFCIEDYQRRDSYQTDTMKKSEPGGSLLELSKVVSGILGDRIIYRSGNFYQHSRPYLPHTDYRTSQDNTINVVIPLHHPEMDAHLVIFDQAWYRDSVTWCMHHSLQQFAVNTGVLGWPEMYEEVTNLTGNTVSSDLYIRYLSRFPKNTLHGLSGTALPWMPGSVLIFDNRLIHCTSDFTGNKLGISLRFSIA